MTFRVALISNYFDEANVLWSNCEIHINEDNLASRRSQGIILVRVYVTLSHRLHEETRSESAKIIGAGRPWVGIKIIFRLD